MTGLRATLRPLRTELLGVAGLTALVLLAAGAIAARLLAYDMPAACFDFSSVDPACVARQYDVAAYMSLAGNWGGMIAVGAAVLPAIAGVILGIAAVAKELDQRTAVLAWSVGPSRRRWLLQRVVPLLGVVVVLGIVSVQLGAAMLRLNNPGSETFPGQEFERIGSTGFGPMAGGISAFGITVVVGAMLGRILPALLAAAAFVVFGALLIQQGNERLMAGESLVADVSLAGPGRQLDSLLRTPDGRIISWNEAFPAYADPETGQLRAGMTEMTRYVPSEIAPAVAARYALLHVVVGLMALTLAFAVVERRSP